MPSHRACETAAIAAVAAALLGLAWRVGQGAEGAGSGAVLLAMLLAGHVAADFVSGLAHWLADRVLSEELPYLGPHFVRPFREHHLDPAAIARHDFIETNGNTCLVVLPGLAATLLWVDPGSGRGEFAGASFALFLGLWTCSTNQFHKWAHSVSAPRCVRRLQRARLILDPGHHALHHQPPFRSRFCITTGWLNPVLDLLGVFARLEHVLGAVPDRTSPGLPRA